VSYKVAKLGQIEEAQNRDSRIRPVRHHLGITAFGVNAFTGHAVGDRVVNEHDEDDDQHEELYLVLSGRARFEIGGDTVDASEGTLVFVEPGVQRTAFAETEETTVLVVGAPRGKPYDVVGWEVWASLQPFYEAGDYEAVIEQGQKLIEAYPEYALPLYNLACCESLAGRPQEAIGHLHTAIDRSANLRDFARKDSDFDPIRDDPGFRELVEV
jgi:tetratricopeptide (TPR) repeat protein